MRIEHHERVIGQAERDEAEKQEEERQHRKQEHKEPRKKYGFITVSMGDGLKTLFEELGADRVIEGGQTMNPSTEDMLNAIDDVNAENIFILPNNKNVVLAANQAACKIKCHMGLTKSSGMTDTDTISICTYNSIQKNIHHCGQYQKIKRCLGISQ